MNQPAHEPIVPDSGSPGQLLLRLTTIVLLLFVFLVGVKGLGDGFKMLGRDLLDAFFSATENPLVSSSFSARKHRR